MTIFFAGGGKSECYKTLHDALNLLHQTDPQNPANQSVTSFCLNPKSISLGELYGAYNPVSNDWKDGLASKLVREAMADDSNSMKWLVFDGPVDAVWVENLNTVGKHASGSLPCIPSFTLDFSFLWSGCLHLYVCLATLTKQAFAVLTPLEHIHMLTAKLRFCTMSRMIPGVQMADYCSTWRLTCDCTMRTY